MSKSVLECAIDLIREAKGSMTVPQPSEKKVPKIEMVGSRKTLNKKNKKEEDC